MATTSCPLYLQMSGDNALSLSHCFLSSCANSIEAEPGLGWPNLSRQHKSMFIEFPIYEFTLIMANVNAARVLLPTDSIRI